MDFPNPRKGTGIHLIRHTSKLHLLSAVYHPHLHNLSVNITQQGIRSQLKKSAFFVVRNSLLIYDYVGVQEGVNPDPDEVRTSSIYMFTGTVFRVGIPVDLQQQQGPIEI